MNHSHIEVASMTEAQNSPRCVAEPDLDLDFYRASYSDLAHMSNNELQDHWHRYGRAEGRLPNRDAGYKAWSDAEARGLDPLTYWLAHSELGDDPALATARALAYWHREGRWGDGSIVDVGSKAVTPSAQLQTMLNELLESLVGEGAEAFRKVLTPEAIEALVELNAGMDDSQYQEAAVALLTEVCPILLEPAVLEECMAENQRLGPFVSLLRLRRRARDHQRIMFDSVPADERRWWCLGHRGESWTEADWSAGNNAASADLEERQTAWPASDEVEEVLAEQGFASESNTPFITVVVSLYRGGRWIHPFMESLAGQSVASRLEVVVVDAASPDDEEAFVREYESRFGRLVYHRVASRIPIYEAWNIAVDLSSGFYLTNANLDDFRHPRSMELQSYVLTRRGADIVYQDYLVSFEGPDVVDFDDVQRRGLVDRLPPVTPRSLLQHNHIHNAPMWRRSLHDRFGLFDEEFRSAGDWDFWLRCVRRGASAVKSPYVTSAYYFNPQGLSTDSGSHLGLREGAAVRTAHAGRVFGSSVTESGTQSPQAGQPSFRTRTEEWHRAAEFALGVLWQYRSHLDVVETR